MNARRSRWSAGLAIAALLLTSCDGGDQDDDERGARDDDLEEQPEELATSTTDGPPPESTTTALPTTTAAAEPPPPSAPTPTPARPQQLESSYHGEAVAAVYLAVSRGFEVSAENRGAEARAAEDGWRASSGDVNCDQGAREQLGLDPEHDYIATAIYFATRSDAETFVDLYEPGVVGVASVTTLCAD